MNAETSQTVTMTADDGTPIQVRIPDADTIADLLARETYLGFPIADLEATFDRIKDPADWRNPIGAEIPGDATKIVAAAIDFYTATKMRIVGGPIPGTGKILIYAKGYRAGPAVP